jgi:hypothetical protein
MDIQIKMRKWRWIGHTLRKPAGAIEKYALDWNPKVLGEDDQGKLGGQ